MNKQILSLIAAGLMLSGTSQIQAMTQEPTQEMINDAARNQALVLNWFNNRVTTMKNGINKIAITIDIPNEQWVISDYNRIEDLLCEKYEVVNPPDAGQKIIALVSSPENANLILTRHPINPIKLSETTHQYYDRLSVKDRPQLLKEYFETPLPDVKVAE